MFRQIRMFLELVRFSHTLFALPFALLAAVMAWHVGGMSEPPRSWRWEELGWGFCCAWRPRGAWRWRRTGWSDRRIDAGNPRTASRHLPAGRLSAAAVWGFAAASAAAIHRLDAAVFAELAAALSLAGRARVFDRLQLHEAVHGVVPLLAWGGADAGAGYARGSLMRGDVVMEYPADMFPAAGRGIGGSGMGCRFRYYLRLPG